MWERVRHSRNPWMPAARASRDVWGHHGSNLMKRPKKENPRSPSSCMTSVLSSSFTTSHLVTVACIQPPHEFMKKQKFNDKHGILRICSTFIYVHSDSKIVEICHFSGTQYLKSPIMSDDETLNKHYLGPNEGNALLMKASFTYLSSQLFAEPLLSPLPLPERHKELKWKLADRVVLYMIFGWIDHAKELKEDAISRDVCKFRSGKYLASWLELWELKSLENYCWWHESEEEIEMHEWSNDLLCELGSSTPSRAPLGSGLYNASCWEIMVGED